MTISGPVGLRALWEKTVQNNFFHLIARQFGADGTTDDTPSFSQDGDRMRVTITIFKDLLFGPAGRVQKTSHLPVVQFDSFTS